MMKIDVLDFMNVLKNIPEGTTIVTRFTEDDGDDIKQYPTEFSIYLFKYESVSELIFTDKSEDEIAEEYCDGLDPITLEEEKDIKKHLVCLYSVKLEDSYVDDEFYDAIEDDYEDYLDDKE